MYCAIIHNIFDIVAPVVQYSFHAGFKSHSYWDSNTQQVPCELRDKDQVTKSINGT